jgi:glycosyltransferase involved in cell wall biosynthesis
MFRILRRLVPRRLRPLARRAYARRYELGRLALRAAIIAGLTASLVATTLAGSWLGVVLTLGAALAGASVELISLYRDRRALTDGVQALAVANARAAGATSHEMPPQLVPFAVRELVRRGDVLDAYALLSGAGPPNVIEVATRLRLWDELQKRGYLRAALSIARSCVAEPFGWRHRARLELLEGEYRVLSGSLDLSQEVPRSADFAPVPGRVLHIVGTSLPTTQAGFTIRTHYIAVAEARAGMTPHVVTQVGYGKKARLGGKTVIDAVTYHRLPGRHRSAVPLDEWLAANVCAVASIVAQVRPAVLHAASDYLNALTARALGDAFNLPVVYESRGFWEETMLARLAHQHNWNLDRLAATHGLPDIYLWRREVEDRCRRDADHVITLADVMADRIEAGGVDRSRITVVPNGVDVDAFPIQSRNRDLAAQLGIADDATVIGYISSIVEYEGIDTLVAAYATIEATTQHPVALLIVGDGPERENLMRQAAELGLNDAIFTGRVLHDRVLAYYSLIDIFVVPRKPVEVCHLVTPLKPFEAFSTGRAVVLSNVRALAAIAAESNAAVLFEAGDEDSLAKTLFALVDDPSHRHRLATVGAAWVRAHRTWAANAATYSRVYAELGAAVASVD